MQKNGMDVLCACADGLFSTCDNTLRIFAGGARTHGCASAGRCCRRARRRHGGCHRNYGGYTDGVYTCHCHRTERQNLVG